MSDIVFMGQGVEYVFSTLAEEARRRGFGVTELDLLNPDWPELMQERAPASFRLVTSHHPYLGKHGYRVFHHVDSTVVALPEFISRYRPARCYYIPHDLCIPYKDDEIVALKYFDALLMPSDRYWHFGQFTRVLPIGWVKASHKSMSEPPCWPLALIPSEIPLLVEKSPTDLAALLGPVLVRKPVVLLPRFAGVEKIITFAEAHGAPILPFGTSVNEVIDQSAAVVSNGTSSVVVEAVVGRKPVVCLTDGIVPLDLQLGRLGELPLVFFGNATAGLDWLDRMTATPDAFAAPQTDILPFDLDRFFGLMNES